MRSFQRRLLLLMGTGALVGGAWVAEGCSQTPPQLFSPDTGLPVFDSAVPPPPVVYADGGPQPVRIVAGSLLGGESGALVVFQDSNGNVTGTTTTNSEGYAEALLPTGSMVSILVGNVNQFPQVVTYMGIEPGDLLVAYDYSALPSSNGNVTVASVPTAMLDATANYSVSSGYCASSLFAAPPDLYTVTAGCVSPFAQFPVLLRAYDSDYDIIGFAFSKNQQLSADGGGVVQLTDAAWSTAQGTWTINVVNGSSTNPSIAFSEVASSVPLADTIYNDFPGPDGGWAPQTFNMHVGYPDFVQSEVDVEIDNENTNVTTITSLATRQAPPTTSGSVTLDMSQLLPTISTYSSDFKTKPAQPIVTFQPDAPITSAVGAVAICSWSNQDDAGGYSNNTWTIVAPPSVTTITAPVLPASALGWTPVNNAYNDGCTLTMISGDTVASYHDFRQVAAVIPTPSYQGSTRPLIQPLPFDGTLALTVVGPCIACE